MGVFDLLRSAKGTFGIKDPALCIEERQPASAGRRCLEFRIGQMHSPAPSICRRSGTDTPTFMCLPLWPQTWKLGCIGEHLSEHPGLRWQVDGRNTGTLEAITVLTRWSPDRSEESAAH